MGSDGSGTDDDKPRTEGSSRQPESDGYQQRLEALFEILTSRRRRYALYFLQEQEVTDLESLATHLALIEQDVVASAVSDEEISRVKTQLVHTDLPALADAQLVEYDRRNEAVRYSAPPPLLEAFLRLSAHIDAPRSQ